MRTERASFFWGAGAFSLACGALAIIMRLAGVGLAVGPIVVRWYLLALCAGLSGLLMALLARRTWVQDLRWRSAEELVVVVGSGDDSTTHIVRVDRSSGRVSASGGDDEWNC